MYIRNRRKDVNELTTKVAGCALKERLLMALRK